MEIDYFLYKKRRKKEKGKKKILQRERINGLDSLQQELKWRHTKKQMHTWGYLFSSLKLVDLCTVLYHQGAHKPSIGFGPASQLENWH